MAKRRRSPPVDTQCPPAFAEQTPPLKPRKFKIPEAVNYSKICRTELYELAKRHKGLFVKNGQATLVDVPILDSIIDGLPPA